MLSKNKIKYLSSLSLKKHRDASGMFLAEGVKVVKDILNTRQNLLYAEELFATEDFCADWQNPGLLADSLKTYIISEAELKKISQLAAPNKAVLLIKIPDYSAEPSVIRENLSLVFESISDPGNLGTIIRTADWFGIRDIFCSPDSADVYNSKVIQSTMGAICRVRVHYRDLKELLENYRDTHGTEITGTLLTGEDLNTTSIRLKNEMLVFGNESRGISANLRKYLTKEVKIPTFHAYTEKSESLNVASAVAIMCWEIARRKQSLEMKI